VDIRTDVLIIGAGFSGMAMGINLRRAGREDFVIIDKADEVGGTWRDNTYPGCACDIPSHLYSYSFAPNPEWTRRYSHQPEILDYLRRIADDFDLRPQIHLGVQMTQARWDEAEQLWRVRTAAGPTYEARFLVSGIGGLHIPNLPRLPGRDDFEGVAFHSARWRHDVDLTGKRVAVIGTGASAVQFVPQIAPTVGELIVFQRTAAWVLPKPDRAITEGARSVFRRLPVVQRMVRDATYWALEARAIGFNGHPGLLRLGERLVARQITRQVADPQVQRRLLPDYRMGCKRVLIANDYYPTFNRDNVQLVDGGVERITATGVVGADGVERAADVIIYGTGFHVIDSFEHVDVVGRDGVELRERFRTSGMQTYLGINVAVFPKIAFLLGPNTALGHNSVVFMIEQQAAYVIRLLDAMDGRGVRAVDVRPQAQHRFNQEIQDRLAKGIWSTGGCASWYLDSHGKNRSIWPGFTFAYWWRTRSVHRDAYEWGLPRRAPDVSQGQVA